MADTNTYTSKQNIKKYTTQAKFDAIDKSDVPVGTEYNIVGEITESDLDSDLQAKVNLTGDNLTTEITGGKVKVKNPMTSTGGNGFKLNSFYNATTGVTYFFPIETPIGHFATGIVPIIGSITRTEPGSSAPATYQGLLLPNAYSENNYGPNAYAMLTMSESKNSGNQIYILPYHSSNQGISHLLSEDSITAGPGVTIRDTTSGQSTPILEISCNGGGSPSIGSKTYADFVVGAHPEILYEPADGTLYAAAQPAADGGSGYTRFVLLAPTGDVENTVIIPNKTGTLATLDDIPTGGGTTYTAGKNIVINGTTIKTKDDVSFDTAVVNALTVATTGIFTRGPINRVPSINFGTSAEPLSATGIYSFANIFTTYKETKTTYNFKIPSVGGYVDIRFPYITYGNLVAQEQLTTLFGNQSLVGTGNIDLYKHTVSITGEEESSTIGTLTIDGYIIFYSSESLECNSLTDLKTVLGDTFVEKAFGYATNIDTGDIFTIDYVNETYVYFSGTTSRGQNGKATVPFTMTLVDAVTTI